MQPGGMVPPGQPPMRPQYNPAMAPPQQPYAAARVRLNVSKSFVYFVTIEREGMQLIQRRNKRCRYFNNTKLREILNSQYTSPVPRVN